MSSRRFFAASTLALLAFGVQVPSAFGDHSWGGYHWHRTSNPLALELGENVSAKWKVHQSSNCPDDEVPYLETASCDWNMSEYLETTVVKGKTNPRNCKPTDGRVEVCSDNYGFNGWLGLAQIWISGGHITKAIVKLNDSYFNTTTYDQPKWRFYAMCHEVGHTFGLSHQDEDFYNDNLGSCLDYTDDPEREPANLHPNKHDYDQLKEIYDNHLDSSSVASGPGNSGRGPGKSVSGFEFATYVRDDFADDWGRVVAFTGNGQPRLFVKDLGDGDRRVTHVLWTEGAKPGQHFPHHLR
jgi:hypothetical protein